MSHVTNIFIFHGTEGHPKENWFPWLKSELEAKDYNVIVPQFRFSSFEFDWML
jgi:predicted alpha/beta-fold hydrolase